MVQNGSLLGGHVMIAWLLVHLLSTQASALSLLPSSSTVEIRPPTTTKEWRQLATLLVRCDDDYSNIMDMGAGASLSFWQSMKSTWQRPGLHKSVLKQYVRKARLMRGKKFALLVAKQHGKVVGLAEMGVTSNDRRSTVGVLVVNRSSRGQGIGTMLLERCEELCASLGWNKTIMYVEVEPSNNAALSFFEQNGYRREGRTVLATVRYQGVSDEKLHLLLYKNLTASLSSEGV